MVMVRANATAAAAGLRASAAADGGKARPRSWRRKMICVAPPQPLFIAHVRDSNRADAGRRRAAVTYLLLASSSSNRRYGGAVACG